MARMEKPARRSNCPLNVALELIGDHWSLLILRDMIVGGKRRYGEFLNSMEGISTNILASRLRQLDSHGIVEKFADPENRKCVIYLPTDKGVDLLPVMLEAMRWGMKHEPGCSVPAQLEHCLQHGCHDMVIATRTAVMAEREELLRRSQA